MAGNSIKNLAQSEKGMDSLLGAATGLELADGDPEFLKHYSERVAAEADESATQEELKEQERQKKLNEEE